jgi:hypothetical protein
MFTMDDIVAKPVLEIAAELENAELCALIVTQPDDSLGLDAIVERSNRAKHLHRDLSEMVDFLASHFYQLSHDALNSLGYDDSILILSHPKLQRGWTVRNDCFALLE